MKWKSVEIKFCEGLAKRSYSIDLFGSLDTETCSDSEGKGST